jgi:plasmid stability protein
MSNVLIRDLPDDVHRVLAHRAERAGQSLQQYLSRELSRLAHTPTLEDALSQIESREGGRVGYVQAAEDLREERDRR